MSNQQFVVLSGIGYNVTVADRQVIFEEAFCIHGFHTRFAFERPQDINNTPGIWYLVHLDTTSERIPAQHLTQAHKWCEENLGRSFEPYKGALA